MNIRHESSRSGKREVPRSATNGDLERWEIKLDGSRLTFVLRHLVISQIHGQFRTWGGTLFLDRAAPWRSSVDVWIDLASLETDSVERDAHIRSPELLDVGRYPRAEFKSTAVEPQGERMVVRGRLQLHGVTHDVDLDVETRTGPAYEGRSVYAIRGKLNRQSFGLHWNQDLDVGGVVVGDEVDLTAEVEIVRAGEDASRQA
jgi:polyisoprenoid-binding protein YceI